ncbi:hypothetical protein DQ403_00090 [Stutzerimonas zhaodongensis]|uniref:Uncharacterized protein n=1 Tax=Stutzerimonas zhaodongensis TaxID=1176257 RepID=A0A365PYJ8_9GAMM|nr:hypothetical protein DQ403_00090 [Stutzerimonas zhaodongensis]
MQFQICRTDLALWTRPRVKLWAQRHALALRNAMRHGASLRFARDTEIILTSINKLTQTNLDSDVP